MPHTGRLLFKDQTCCFSLLSSLLSLLFSRERERRACNLPLFLRRGWTYVAGASWIRRTYWLLYRGLRVLRLLSGNPSQMEPLELRYSATFRVLSSACGWKDTCSQTGARSNGDWADLNEEDIEKPLLDFFNVESFYLFFILNPLFTIHHEYYIRKKIIRVAMRSEARPAINKTLQFLSPSSVF